MKQVKGQQRQPYTSLFSRCSRFISKLNTDKKAMKFMEKYIVTWVCIGVIIVSFIILVNAQRASIVCVDGTHVTQKSLCPECVQDSNCGPDKVCSDNVCIAKSCETDEECDTAQSACIFGKCTKSTGKL